jgi:hypothetical protein
MIQRLGKQLPGNGFNSRRILICQRLCETVINKQFFPEAAALGNAGKVLFTRRRSLPA